MKKKIVMVIMAAVLAVSTTACGAGGQKEEKKETKKETKSEETVKKEEPDIEITLPADFFDEEGMNDINEEAKADGVKEVTVNDDGSVTYKMDKSTHDKLLAEMKKSIDEGITELLEDKENYGSFQEITYNDDMTEFKVMADPASYDDFQSFGALALYAFGNMYQGINQVPESEINTVVQIINKDTQEIIESGDSKSMAQEYEGE